MLLWQRSIVEMDHELFGVFGPYHKVLLKFQYLGFGHFLDTCTPKYVLNDSKKFAKNLLILPLSELQNFNCNLTHWSK